MSTITKEWLQKAISQHESMRDEIPFGLDEDDSNTLEALRIALSSLEAEAVAFVMADDLKDSSIISTPAYRDLGEAMERTVGDVVALYTAPPAPVSVPAAMEMDDDFDSAFEHGKAVGWNAYRAAMLQSFGNSEQLNSPVIQDGWVACVERMPSAGEKVLAYRPDAPESNDPLIKMATYVGGSAHGHGFDCYCKPTHWMPLPAAPQQEVR